MIAAASGTGSGSETAHVVARGASGPRASIGTKARSSTASGGTFRQGFEPTSARTNWIGWYTMLVQRKTSLVQVHSPARIDRRSAAACAECQISGNVCWRRLPIGSCDSQKLTSPFEYTTPFRMPARHGTTWAWASAVRTLAHCSIGSTIAP